MGADKKREDWRTSHADSMPIMPVYAPRYIRT